MSKMTMTPYGSSFPKIITVTLSPHNGLGLEVCGLVASLFIRKTVFDVYLKIDVTLPTSR